MGDVYRAKDTRLDRTVALKVLPGHLAADPDLRQRFEREARAVSSLNHPHICALFDIGQEDGTDYLVLEYLEGETLADRLGRGPLPTDQVLQYGVEIANALDKAHRQGIVHRDLKPGNVMLTKSGAKLLDFGLAKLQAGPSAPAAEMLSAMATAARPLTEAGTVMATFQYMAPEQLEGKEADARTDLFAFGTLLYEMATGRKAFSGKSQASLIAAILSADPPLYTSLEGETRETLDVFVQAFPPAGGRYQISVAGGTHSRWRSDGKEIYYLSSDGTLMAVDVSTSPSGFRAGQPRALFKPAIITRGNPLATSHYAVAADGQRFLFASALNAVTPPPVTVVLNWAAGRKP